MEDNNKSSAELDDVGERDHDSGDETGDSLYEKKWNHAFARLKEFKAKNGHCRVPNRYAEDPQLGNWVSTQRRQYRILTTGLNKTVPLTQERAQQLIALGFEWSAKDPTHKTWDERFQELVAFKAQHGSTLVPMGWSENPRLATWVSTQRQEYKQMKQGHSSRLNEEKVLQLNSIGFVWEAQRGRRKLPNPLDAMMPDSGTKPVANPVPALQMRGVPSSFPVGVQGQSNVSQPATPATASAATTATGQQMLLELLKQAQSAAPGAAAPTPSPHVSSVPAATSTATLAAAPAKPSISAGGLSNQHSDLMAFLRQVQSNGQPVRQTENPPPRHATVPTTSSPLPQGVSTVPQPAPRSSGNQGSDPGAASLLAALTGAAAGNRLTNSDISTLAEKLGLSTTAGPRALEQNQNHNDVLSLLRQPGQNQATAPPSSAAALPQTFSESGTSGSSSLKQDANLSNQLKQVMALLGQTNESDEAPKPDTSGVTTCLKRTLDRLMGLPGENQSSDISYQLMKLLPSTQGENPPTAARTHQSQLGDNSAGERNVLQQLATSLAGESRAGTAHLSEAQALAVVHLYATSLAPNAQARSSLLAASNLTEAQNVLKADILRSFISNGPGQDNQDLQTLFAGILQQQQQGVQSQQQQGQPHHQQQAVAAQPSQSLTEVLQALVPGSSQTASTAAVDALPQTPRQAPQQQPSAGPAVQFSRDDLSRALTLSLENMLKSRASNAGSQSQTLPTSSSSGENSAPGNDWKMPPAKRRRSDP